MKKTKAQKRQDIINKISWMETSSAYGPLGRSKRRKELNAQLKKLK